MKRTTGDRVYFTHPKGVSQFLLLLMLIRGRRRARAADVADDLDEFLEADVSVTWRKIVRHKLCSGIPCRNRASKLSCRIN